MCLLLVFLYSLQISCRSSVEPIPLIEGIPEDTFPAWSPDGNWIAYHHFNPDPHDSTYVSGLYLTDINGNNRKLVVAGDALCPDWSPDGRRLVFSTGDIFTIGVNGDSLVQLTYSGSSFFPSWSPTGEKIAFSCSAPSDSSGIWIMESEGSNKEHLGLGYEPNWSVEGKKFVYVGPPGHTTAESQIWITNIDGSGTRQLTFNNVLDSSPAFSHNILLIAWNSGGEIWVMNSDGSNQHKITNGVEPSWSPDSKQIVFSRLTQNQERRVLWIISIDGTGARQLTH